MKYYFLAPPLFGMLSNSPSPASTLTSSPTDRLNKHNQHVASEKHVLNVLHFPIPIRDENVHDKNQRLVVLFGVGKVRQDEKNKIKDIVDRLDYLFDLNNTYGSKRKGGMSEMMLKSSLGGYDKKAVLRYLDFFHLITRKM